jgi:ABC-type transport system involved in cytochrome c biogenesis permease subunit
VSYRIIGHWTTPKIVWAFSIWLIYAGLSLARQFWSVRGRRIAWASVWAFVVALVSYWGISYSGAMP